MSTAMHRPRMPAIALLLFTAPFIDPIDASSTGCAPSQLLPLLAGGDWEGVARTCPDARLNNPTPTLPCMQGREQVAQECCA